MKALLTGIFLFISVQSFGQLEKGMWLVGGSGSFATIKSLNIYSSVVTDVTDLTEERRKVKKAELSTSLGYFFIDKLASGIKLDGRLEKENYGRTHVLNFLSMRAGPFVRYYFLDTEKPFNLLIDASYKFGFNKNLEYPSGKNNSFQLMAGSEVFFNTSAGLEILVGYDHTVAGSEKGKTFTQNGFRTSVGFTFHLIKD